MGKIQVEGPGGTEFFPEGTSVQSINAYMAKKYGAPPATPGATPGATVPAVTQPAGTRPSGLTVVPGAPDAALPSLSPEAENARRMQLWGLVSSDPHMSNDARHFLETDPTYQTRSAATKVLGETAGQISKKQQLAQEAYGYMQDWINLGSAWHEHNPKAFEGAVGYWKSDPRVQGWSASGPSYAYGKSQQHIADALGQLVKQIGSAGGPNSEGDALRFQEAIALAKEQADFAGWNATMHDAKNMLRSMGQLPKDFELPEYNPVSQQNIELINRHSPSRKVNPGSRFNPYQLETVSEVENVPNNQYFMAPGTKKLMIKVDSLDAGADLPPGTMFTYWDAASNSWDVKRVRRNPPPGVSPVR